MSIVSRTAPLASEAPAARRVPCAGTSSRTGSEVALLLALCLVVFLPGLGALPFYGTEPQRALVAKEMNVSGRWLRPTLHGRLELDKPPLMQWCIIGLTRLAGRHEFSERLARVPSVLAAIGYVLVLYVAAGRIISHRCRLLAALLGLCNFSFIEYAVRAELDLGFLCFYALSTLLLWPLAAGPCGGPGVKTDSGSPPVKSPRLWLQWSAVYLALLAATFFKGPHAFLFMFLNLLALSFASRSLRWLLNTAHLVTGTLAVATVVAWYAWLAWLAGSASVSHWALVEVYHRLVPESFAYLGRLATAPLQLYIAALPSSFLAGMWLFRAVRTTAPDDLRPALCFVLCTLTPNAVFLMLARIDATRYPFPVFTPLTLLAAIVWETHLRTSFASHLENGLLRSLGTGLAVLAAGGAAALAVGLTFGLMILPDLSPAYTRQGVCIVIVAGVLAVLGLRKSARAGTMATVLGLAAVLLTTKAWHQVWYAPTRAGQFEHGRVIAELRRATHDGPLFVYGRQPLPDALFYFPGDVRWPEDPEDAFRWTGDRPAYFVLRSRNLPRGLPFDADRIQQSTTVQAGKSDLLVLEVAPLREPRSASSAVPFDEP